MKFGEEYIATRTKWTPFPRTTSAWLRANASRNERVGHFRLRLAVGQTSCSHCLQPRPRSTQAASGRLILPDPFPGKIESYWYPVWLAYPTGMLDGARLLDAPSHHVSAEETINIAKEYEFLVLYTSTPGFPGDIRLAERIKQSNPNIKIAFVGPHVTVLPEQSLKEGRAIDVAVRKEFDYVIPAGLTEQIEIGSRVQVPFGARKVLGCVTALAEESDRANLKPILKVLGAQSLVTPGVLKLARWMGEYYCCAPEVALKSVLPEAVRQEEAGWRERLYVRALPFAGDLPKLSKRQKEKVSPSVSFPNISMMLPFLHWTEQISRPTVLVAFLC